MSVTGEHVRIMDVARGLLAGPDLEKQERLASNAQLIHEMTLLTLAATIETQSTILEERLGTTISVRADEVFTEYSGGHYQRTRANLDTCLTVEGNFAGFTILDGRDVTGSEIMQRRAENGEIYRACLVVSSDQEDCSWARRLVPLKEIQGVREI